MLENEKMQLNTRVFWSSRVIRWCMAFGMLSMVLAMCSCSKNLGSPNLAPENQVKAISYSETGPFGPSELLVIDFEKNEITYETSSTPWDVSADDKNYQKYKYNAREAVKIIKKWQTFDFSKWKERYEDPFIHDGTFWRMEITYKDGTQRKLSGANKWPEDYHGFGLKGNFWETVK